MSVAIAAIVGSSVEGKGAPPQNQHSRGAGPEAEAASGDAHGSRAAKDAAASRKGFSPNPLLFVRVVGWLRES